MSDRTQIRQLYIEQVQKPDGAIDLAKTALLIAKEEYPELDMEFYLDKLDAMARAIVPTIAGIKDPEKILMEINRYLFEEIGLKGNSKDYYNPQNSFLNDVIDLKLGIPITLSLVYIVVAKRVGVVLEGIGFPGHFLVRYNGTDNDIYIDAFNQGKIMTEEDCIQKIDEMYQGQLAFQPEFLKPVTHKQYLTRMLTNLKGIYMNDRDFKRALEVIERILLLNPDVPQELRDRGILRMALENHSGALGDFRKYLKLAPSAPDIDQITMYIQEVMGHIARNN